MRVTPIFSVTAIILAVALTGLSIGFAPAPASAQVEYRYLLIGGSDLPADLEALVAAVGGRVLIAFPEIGVAVVASADPAFPISAASLPGVQSVVPDGTMGLDSTADFGAMAQSEPVVAPEGVVAEGVPAVNALQWNLITIRADQAWSRGFSGSGVQVAVLDTGIDYRHQELAGQVDMLRSISLIGREERDNLNRLVPLSVAPFIDLHLHGTHVASVIAGKGVRFPGVAPQAQLIAVKVLDKTGYGPESAVIAGILYAASAGADIINMSLGFVLPRHGRPYDDAGGQALVEEQQLEALRRAVVFAQRRGVLMIASAGNTGSNLDLDRTMIKAPAGVRPVVGVSATTPTDQLASFSDYGRSVVYMSAPGTGIFGAANTVYFPPRRDPATGALLFAYVGMNGTSQAAAHVSGVAALMNGRMNGINGQVMRDRLGYATDDVGPHGRDIYFGRGRINALRGVILKIHPRDRTDEDD